MEIYGKYPVVVGNSEEINKQFSQWWKYINSIGGIGFALFLSCLGTGDHKFYAGVASLFLYLWALFIVQSRFPKTLKLMRKSKRKKTREFANVIINKHVPVIKMAHLFFPFWLGTVSLIFLAFYPICVQDFSLYILPIIT